MADVILIVLQLDLTCLRNTARLLQLFQQFDGLHRAGPAGRQPARARTRREISLKKAEETLQMPISWQIPNATKLVPRRAGQGGADRRGRRRQPRPPGDPRDRHGRSGPFPAAEEAKPRRGPLRRLLLTDAPTATASRRRPLAPTDLDRRSTDAGVAAMLKGLGRIAVRTAPARRPGRRPGPGRAPPPAPTSRARRRRAAARADAAAAAGRARAARGRQGARPGRRGSTRRSSATSTCGWSTGST